MITISNYPIGRTIEPIKGDNYTISIDGTYTVDSFISEVIEVTVGSWGIIRICKGSKILDICEYAWGDGKTNLSDETLGMTVDNYHCYAVKNITGSSTRVDFSISVIDT